MAEMHVMVMLGELKWGDVIDRIFNGKLMRIYYVATEDVARKANLEQSGALDVEWFEYQREEGGAQRMMLFGYCKNNVIGCFYYPDTFSRQLFFFPRKRDQP